jgi:hypothetical protein
MQKSSRQALLKSKAKLTRRKEHLLMFMPKRLGSESATPLERVVEISEGTVRIGRWYPSKDSKLETAKVADPASSRFYSGPKLQRERLAGHKFGTTLSVRSKVALRYVQLHTIFLKRQQQRYPYFYNGNFFLKRRGTELELMPHYIHK